MSKIKKLLNKINEGNPANQLRDELHNFSFRLRKQMGNLEDLHKRVRRILNKNKDKINKTAMKHFKKQLKQSKMSLDVAQDDSKDVAEYFQNNIIK